MKYTYLFSLLILFACKNKEADLPEKLALNGDSVLTALMDIDKSWSEAAVKKGYHRSRLDFAADNAINMLTNEMPLVGKEAITKYADAHPDTGFTISWKPLKGDLSESCDLGYTYGSWSINTKTKAGKDTTFFGNYVTIWKMQSDGSWKYVIDGGGSTPQEVKE